MVPSTLPPPISHRSSLYTISYRSRRGAVIWHGVGKDGIAVAASMARPAMLLSFLCFFSFSSIHGLGLHGPKPIGFLTYGCP
ncbi:hypothetical protein DAI22_05g171300 [Oryza sativa Japonica Group]|nr:hypothetical protein DAI22_05g171300 [Oryza sativa Japonica Group]